MEHRCSLRHATNVKILIYKSGLPMAVGRLRNVSRNGLFVSTDYDNVALNQMLEIEILGGRCERAGHRWRCRAMVVHVSGPGFGVAVDEDCETSVELAKELFSGTRSRSHAFSSMSLAESPLPRALRA